VVSQFVNQQILEIRYGARKWGLHSKFQNKEKQKLMKENIAATVLQRGRNQYSNQKNRMLGLDLYFFWISSE